MFRLGSGEVRYTSSQEWRDADGRGQRDSMAHVRLSE